MNDTNYEPTDRRPIQSRNTKWAAQATALLVQVGVSPNLISVIGMIAAIGAGIVFAATANSEGLLQRMLWLAGGALCQVRLLCNLFDGMVAVQRGIASATGELYNEVPDRVSDAAVFIGLGYAVGSNIALGYIAALLAVFVAYVRVMAKSTGTPNDFCGPMAKPQRMAVVTLLAIYLAISPPDWRLDWGETKLVLVIVTVGCAITAMRRLSRAAKHLAKPQVDA